jgi:uncharacterized protein (TIGR02266 family)
LEKTFFRRENFDLLVARNGRQAFDLIVAERPDLVFMDLYMPEMNGDECCARVKADPALAATPVVMVTQAGREEDIARCRRGGANEIVLKPINRHHLVETARRLLAVEDRREPRVTARLRVHYGPDPKLLLSDYSLNISSGGLFLETGRPLPVDTPLELEFILPAQPRAIRCRGRVAWVNEAVSPVKPNLATGMGVQFLDIGLDDLHAIREFIKHECLSPSW